MWNWFHLKPPNRLLVQSINTIRSYSHKFCRLVLVLASLRCNFVFSCFHHFISAYFFHKLFIVPSPLALLLRWRLEVLPWNLRPFLTSRRQSIEVYLWHVLPLHLCWGVLCSFQTDSFYKFACNGFAFAGAFYLFHRYPNWTDWALKSRDSPNVCDVIYPPITAVLYNAALILVLHISFMSYATVNVSIFQFFNPCVIRTKLTLSFCQRKCFFSSCCSSLVFGLFILLSSPFRVRSHALSITHESRHGVCLVTLRARIGLRLTELPSKLQVSLH